MTRLRLRVGDIFSIPIDDSSVGVGQIAASYGKSAHYFAVFNTVTQVGEKLDLDLVASSELIFLALSLDAKLFAGHWKVQGNRPVSGAMPLPAFKIAVGTAEQIYVEDFSGKKRRLASNEEIELLPYREIVAPVRLEKALRARRGLLPWVEEYDSLIPNEKTTTADLFG